MVLFPAFCNDIGSTSGFFSEAYETEHVLQERDTTFTADSGIELLYGNKHSARIAHKNGCKDTKKI